MIDICLKYLDWDSEQLGYNCGLIDCTRVEASTDATILVDSINKVINENKNVIFITIKLPQYSIDTVNLLVQRGISLIDTELRYRFTRASVRCRNPTSANCKLEYCSKVDSGSFLELADEMHLSRFYIDSNIPREKANYLWQTSIKNHCEGFADKLLIGYYNNTPCSIVTIRFEDLGNIYLHIVGVKKKFQGKGFGTLMLNKIIEKYANKYVINVETQSNNIPAQSLYEKAGFKIQSFKYVLHYWSSLVRSG